MIYTVEITKRARKQLRRAPQHVVDKLLGWIEAVGAEGLEEIRKLKGFHDHPLKGTLQDKRAISLSKQWRAVYEVKERRRQEVVIKFAEVKEVHPHAY